MENLRYPIGRYEIKEEVSSQDINRWINEIRNLPAALTTAVSSLSDQQLDTRYRNEGWTLRQVVHHIADSHLNGYIRIKLALTENHPTIPAYDQDAWARLPDMTLPIQPSLNFIRGLHNRWAYLLNSLDEQQLNRELIHPISGTMVVKHLIGLYAWHGNHHLAHITMLKKRKNWN